MALHLCVGQALNSFRTAIVSSDDVLHQWRPEDPDPCRWKGVTCDPKSKRVTSLWVAILSWITLNPDWPLYCGFSMFIKSVD